MDSAVGSGSLTESASLNVEAHSLDTFSALVSGGASCFKAVSCLLLKLNIPTTSLPIFNGQYHRVSCHCDMKMK